MKIPEPTAEQTAIWRKMTGQQRLEEAEKIFWEVRNQVEQEVRSEHPDWADKEVLAEIGRRLEELSR